MKFLLVCILALLCFFETDARAQSFDCNQIVAFQRDLERSCVAKGHVVPEYGSSCGAAKWKVAKVNIDWVMTDSGARNSYKQAMVALKPCFGANPESSQSLLAVQYAQRHNENAACTIVECYSDYNSPYGYYHQLAGKGILPE